jgi:hypothetical protein
MAKPEKKLLKQRGPANEVAMLCYAGVCLMGALMLFVAEIRNPTVGTGQRIVTQRELELREAKVKPWRASAIPLAHLTPACDVENWGCVLGESRKQQSRR